MIARCRRMLPCYKLVTPKRDTDSAPRTMLTPGAKLRAFAKFFGNGTTLEKSGH